MLSNEDSGFISVILNTGNASKIRILPEKLFYGPKLLLLETCQNAFLFGQFSLLFPHY